MVRDRWIVNLRNQVANLAGECDSAAAINGARMTSQERAELQQMLRAVYEWVDHRIF